MARTPINKEVIDLTDKQIDTGKMADAMGAMRSQELAVIEANAATETRVRAMATAIGYALPADVTDPDLIQRDISINMRRSIEACLEVGRGLRVLKEACPHGNFISRLDVLGIDTRVAQRFMASAAKFSKAASTPLLAAAGNQTKLFEMLVLDDDQIEELELTGQTGELTLDAVATMSVKELRAALRELQAEHDGSEQVRSDLRAKIDRLERSAKRVKTMAPDEALAGISKEATAYTMDALGAVRGNVRASLQALADHHLEHGGETVQVFMAGLLGQLQAALNALRSEFNLAELADDDGAGVTPEVRAALSEGLAAFRAGKSGAVQ